jgi:hypothetical protein
MMIMGIEYKLTIKGSTPADLDRLLRDVHGFVAFRPNDGAYEFRSATTLTTDMPGAEARIETDGLYFCDYGADGSRLLDELMRRLSLKYGTVPKRDYE